MAANPPIRTPRALALLLALALAFTGILGPLVPATAASPNGVVVSELRFRGPSGGNDEFIELLNTGTATVDISNWKLQGCADGSGAVSDRTTVPVGTSLAAGQHYLFINTGASGYSGTVPGDRTYSTGFSDNNTGQSGARIVDAAGTVVDGAGTANSPCREGTGLTFPTTNGPNTAFARKLAGTQDTDNNLNDFTGPQASDPQNRGTDPVSTNPSGTGAATPATVAPGGTTLLTVAVTPGTNPSSTGLAVAADLTATGGAAAQPLFDDGTNGDAASGDNTFSFATMVAGGTAPGPKSLPTTIADAQGRTGSAAIALTVSTTTPGPLRIRDLQGAAHVSPYAGETVANVPGVVIHTRANGFYLQDPSPDSDDATSEAIFVFTSSPPAVTVGDSLLVGGIIAEFRPGGASGTNLTITELTDPTLFTVSTGTPLPAPTTLGVGGRPIPTTVIEDDVAGSVETSGTFDPANDGIDFFESLEGMRVQVNDAVAVGPTSDFGSNREIAVLADNGTGASLRTPRGGIVIRPTDFNPERIILNDATGQATLPDVSVGASFPGATVGVMDYSFGNFKLQVAQLPGRTGTLDRQVLPAAGLGQIGVATFNVENLDPGDGAAKFNTLAALIVANLGSPDILALEEIQDNNGPTNDSVVDATTTLTMLVAAIRGAGGPTYSYRLINPADDQDGGEPGGNIRVAFLFRTDRGLAFVDRPGGCPTCAVAVTGSGGATRLTTSPGRIAPTNPAFNTSRKPLAGEFTIAGQTLFVIANHFNSKGGDDPLFGRFQPPTRSSEVQRHQQATILRDFVASILAADPNANVVALGDFNDFQFSDTVTILKSAGLADLIETLPEAERYSYVFEGNSQTLDHILVSAHLLAAVAGYQVAHVNAEFADQASDHDPQVARFDLTPPAITIATPAAGATYTLNQIVPAAYSCADTGGAGVATCAGTVASGQPLDTATVGSKTFVVVAADAAGNRAVASVTYTVGYAVCPLYDPAKAHKAGSVVPLKLRLCDASGADVASPAIVVHATGLAKLDNSATGTVEDAGNANPDSAFRYDAALGGYIFNLSTKGLTTGTWRLTFTVNGVAGPAYVVTFDIR